MNHRSRAPIARPLLALAVVAALTTLAGCQKSGAKVPSSWVDDRMTFSDNAPAGMKASMLHDLEAGNRLELDWLTGKIVALGKELGVPTPGSDAVYAAVKLHRMGKQG